MLGIFKKERGSSTHSSERPPRHSRGWIEVRTYLEKNPSLRVLDFGTTSPANINYLTSRGHSVYMANIVQDATRPEWLRPAQRSDAKEGETEFDVDGFISANLDFSGRDFDVILLWDTANYLPPELVPALFARLRQVLRPDGLVLAFFHGRLTGPETVFARFQLGDPDELVALNSGDFPVRKTYQTRQVETFFEGYSSMRFFLGKDNVREVIAIR
ncbi:MAG: class I SAM-dependent methyltransferase [Acidobacteriaceae bacterium]